MHGNCCEYLMRLCSSAQLLLLLGKLLMRRQLLTVIVEGLMGSSGQVLQRRRSRLQRGHGGSTSLKLERK